MKDKMKGYTLAEFLITILAMAGIGGWIANIVKLVDMLDGDVTAMFIARIVGIFAAPLGAVLGYF